MTASAAEQAFDQVVGAMETLLPSLGVPRSYFRGFVRRNRPAMVRALADALVQRSAQQSVELAGEVPAELWTKKQRTTANLAAMKLAARKSPEEMTDEDRRVLATYSGWGGLSIEAVQDQFPADFPVPEERGLIHEYYTPSKVCAEIGRVLTPYMDTLDLPRGETLWALEPSAAIGRLVRGCSTKAFVDKGLRWHAVEYSQVSSRMLKAMFEPGYVTVYNRSFESWIEANEDQVGGRIHLLVSNPPYGVRGESMYEDTDRSYREKKNAYAYFLRRCLDLLAPAGIGVFLIPTGFLTGQGKYAQNLRRKVLRRHHLMSAYRLPSRLFPGAMLATDLLFFRSRGGELTDVAEEDTAIHEGRYYAEHPDHILGEEVNADGADDHDMTRKPRWGYEIRGEFDKLPDLVERPFCRRCQLTEVKRRKRRKPGGTVKRIAAKAGADLPPELDLAETLGLRVDRYLAVVAGNEPETALQLWAQLVPDLRAWAKKYGNPHAHAKLRKLLSSTENVGLERFSQSFHKDGKLLPTLADEPKVEAKWQGRPADAPGQAALLYGKHHLVALDPLISFHRSVGGTLDKERIKKALYKAGWCFDFERNGFVPASSYYVGFLWPKYDAARQHARMDNDAFLAQGHTTIDRRAANEQADKLLAATKPAVFDDIRDVSPQQVGWVPVRLVQDWINQRINGSHRSYHGALVLEQRDGLLQVKDVEYENLRGAPGVQNKTRWVLGWINHDYTNFRPPKRHREEKIHVARERAVAEWTRDFRSWLRENPARMDAIEYAYNRHFRGFVQPTFSSEPVHVARWNPDAFKPRHYQTAAARRLLENRGGICCLDVGLGKTLSAMLVIGRAKQEGWVKRPVVLVPNSLIWKWYEDFRFFLPDYRVVVIGGERYVARRGKQKGRLVGRKDTAEERAQKWIRFQGGEYDVAVLAYTELETTKLNVDAVRQYAETTAAIRRQVKLAQRNAASKKPHKRTERDKAIIQEGVAAWVAGKMEIGKNRSYLKGVAWDTLGIDMLVVDEAQNYKNLYGPEPRVNSAVPKFMGSAGTDTVKRAWQLDFRCQTIRNQGGSIVLLSATPAKNSPLELYNLVQFVDHDAWERIGILDPEAFIDRFLDIKVMPVVNPKGEVEERAAVVGFVNLDEFRDVVYRYCEFRTAEQVGLPLPTTTVERVWVEMDEQQAEKTREYRALIRKALKSQDRGERQVVLGLLAKLSMVAIHGRLDERFDWRTAASKSIDPESPKLLEIARRVAAERTCGHIVFCDYIAAHRWMQRCLVKAGVDADRIAVLNAKTAKDPAKRQRIASEFNGDPEEGIEPKYDVVIANNIAYEGVDLQKRTCAIHHADLPWEPATLQQRNGRGRRQGNQLGAIKILYYLARRSQDGVRFNMIHGKAGWMQGFLGEENEINNPAAQSGSSDEEILAFLADDEEKARQILAEIRKRHEDDARKKQAKGAGQMLRSASARYRKAEGSQEPKAAQLLREEADDLLAALGEMDSRAWPWAAHAGKARESDVLTSPEWGVPLYEGLRVAIPAAEDESVIVRGEFGRVTGDTIGYRSAGSGLWALVKPEQYDRDYDAAALKPLEWPEDDDERAVQDVLDKTGGYYFDWKNLRWQHAADAWIERIWPRVAGRLLEVMEKAYNTRQQRLPMLQSWGDNGQELRIGAARDVKRSDALVLPPTQAGWQEFLGWVGRTSTKQFTYTQLNEAAAYWWGRTLPRGLQGREPVEGAA